MTELSQEPIRGGYPPDGTEALSGVDFLRGLVHGTIPRPPHFRLLGIRLTHASNGTATLAMPASPWLGAGFGFLDVVPLVNYALAYAALSTAPPGAGIGMHILTLNYVRRPKVEMESFVARARCVSASRRRATTEAQVEDADGRLVIFATGQVAIGTAEREVGGQPALVAKAEPAYPSPDPPARPMTPDWDPRLARELDGLPLIRRLYLEEGRLPPAWRLTGTTMTDVERGTCTLSMPASEWLSNTARNIANGALMSFLATALHHSIASLRPAGTGVALHSFHAVLVGDRVPRPGGAGFMARASANARNVNSIVATGDVIDIDRDTHFIGNTTATFFDAPDSTLEISPDRVLAAVLYADIVESTPRTEALGDARWREVLEEFQERSRKEILTFRGREVKWTGDGMLATFDSPARAVQCARAIRDAARGQAIEMRSGVHVGECELMGTDVTGIAVVVAKRVMDAAPPGEILVTSTVREASAGAGLRFADRGRHALKGIEGDWQLFAVEG